LYNNTFFFPQTTSWLLWIIHKICFQQFSKETIFFFWQKVVAVKTVCGEVWGSYTVNERKDKLLLNILNVFFFFHRYETTKEILTISILLGWRQIK